MIVIDFLTELFDKEFSYSAINTARSALSSYVFLIDSDGYQVGDHPMISRILKSAYQLRTPLPKYKDTWDVEKLLDYFKSQDDSELHLKEHSQKLCALLLINSAQRVQTIHLLKLKYIFIHEKGCTIIVSEKLKSTRPTFHQKPIELERKIDKKVCVVNCLEEYILRTENLRGDTDNLMVCHKKPHGPAHKDTIARWLKELLGKAGIEGYGAHSFRSASSSDFLRKGVPVADILKKGGWTNAKTFHRFYNRCVSEPSKEEGQKSILNYLKCD